MDELIINLGKKVQQYRKKKDITLKELAEKIGVTPSLLSQIENGKAAPSLSTLSSIADVFNVHIGVLFESSSKAPISPIVKKNTHKRVITDGNVKHSLLSPGCDEMEIILNEFPAHSMTGEKGYVHKGMECGYLLKGEIYIEIDGVEYQMQPGDSVVFDSSKPHRVINKGEELAVGVWAESLPWIFKGE